MTLIKPLIVNYLDIRMIDDVINAMSKLELLCDEDADSMSQAASTS